LKIGYASNLLQKLAVFEVLVNGDDVDRFAFIEHPGHGLEDGLMAEIVKDFCSVFAPGEAFSDAFVGREEDATEYAHFGFD